MYYEVTVISQVTVMLTVQAQNDSYLTLTITFTSTLRKSAAYKYIAAKHCTSSVLIFKQFDLNASHLYFVPLNFLASFLYPCTSLVSADLD
jgi:hypothetical protein